MLEEAQNIKKMAECTFKPQILSQKQNRNFDQFLKDQQQFEENKKKKQKEKKEQQICEMEQT